MKFPILIACFLIPSLASGDEIPKSKRFRCGFRPMAPPPLDQPRFPRPHSIQDDQPFVPYKILYLIDDSIDLADHAKLEMATDYVNGKLSKAVKARVVNDVRFQNLHRDCLELCAGLPFPNEYVLPCRSIIIPEPTDKIKKQNEANYTLVMRALVRYQGVIANDDNFPVLKQDCSGQTIAFAQSCGLMGPEISKGPHHGYFVVCVKPTSLTDEGLGDLVLHETLHALMPISLSGIWASNQNCMDEITCKDLTWKEVKRQALNGHNRPVDITAGIAIGPLFQQAARDHFGCETAEGIEMNIFEILNKSSMETEVDHGHWSEHLFPDEVMAPYQSTTSHFSILTLTALASHVKWYKVNLSLAEPLVTSKPSEEFACDVAQKTCFEILKEQSNKGVKFIRPFCDTRTAINRTIVSHCSPDHQRQLSCRNDVSDSGCAHLMGTLNYMYDAEKCANTSSMKAGALASNVGASVGGGTICVTTTNFPPWELHTTNALCLHHECHGDSLILKFNPNSNKDPNCYITCTKGQSKQLFTVNWCNKAGHEVTIICPDYEQVCKKETTTPATTSTVQKTTKSCIRTATSTVPQITSTAKSTGSAAASFEPGHIPTSTIQDIPPAPSLTPRVSISTAVQSSSGQKSVWAFSLKTLPAAFICIEVLAPVVEYF